MLFWIALVLLVLWLGFGSLKAVAGVLFWVVVIVLLLGALGSGLDWLRRQRL